LRILAGSDMCGLSFSALAVSAEKLSRGLLWSPPGRAAAKGNV